MDAGHSDVQWCLPLINHVARAGRRAGEYSTSPGDLRPRHVVALKLLSERGALSQQMFGESLSLDPSNVVGLLNELEERGLITRRRDPADRRRHIVEISTDGEAEFAVACMRIATVEDEVLHALNAQERATLHQLLSRVISADRTPCDAHTDEV